MVDTNELRELLGNAYQWPPSNLDTFIDKCEEILPALLDELGRLRALEADAERIAFLDRTFLSVKVRNGRRYESGPGSARYIIDAARAYHEAGDGGEGG